jgi:hypothetical protein
MFTHATLEAIEFIIKNQPTCRVTRNQAAFIEAAEKLAENKEASAH